MLKFNRTRWRTRLPRRTEQLDFDRQMPRLSAQAWRFGHRLPGGGRIGGYFPGVALPPVAHPRLFSGNASGVQPHNPAHFEIRVHSCKFVSRPAASFRPEKPSISLTKICENPSKNPHRQPSSTPKTFGRPTDPQPRHPTILSILSKFLPRKHLCIA
jgi:hypothetical protein